MSTGDWKAKYNLPGGPMGELPVKTNDLVQVRILGEEPGSAHPCHVDDIVNDKIILGWPTGMGVTIALRIGQPVTVYFIREDAVYSFEAIIEETVLEPIPRIALRQAGAVHRIQRRAYFRVRAMLPVQLTGVVGTGDSDKEDAGSTVHIVTSTVDISGAGMAIHYSKPLPADTVFDVRLTVEPAEPQLRLLARVVHSEPVIGVADERRVYHIAFFFVAISETQRRKIVRRCFRIQQENLAH